MRVVVTGATGNVGTSLLSVLADEPAVASVLGVARRPPRMSFAKTEWAVADVATDDLDALFAGADAVVHLAWLIQPSRDLHVLRATNVDGSARVFEAAARAGVGALVYASSVGAYSPGPKDRAVDESWPTDGIESSFYARHKSEVERLLDDFERRHPSLRVVRLRPGLIFKREAASGIRRLFAGPLLPGWLMRRSLVPLVPDIPRLRFQAVHSLDVGDAYRRALVSEVRGAFNIAADPVLDPAELGRLLGARRVPVPARVVRSAAHVTWKLRLQPSPPGWVDMALAVPLMDTRRARAELGWQPRFTGGEALLELLAGLRDRAGLETPPLSPGAGGPLRLREFASGVGARGPGGSSTNGSGSVKVKPAEGSGNPKLAEAVEGGESMTRVDHDRANGSTRDTDERSVGELVQLLTTQVSTLARKEMELAKLELSEKGKVFGIGGGMIGAAGLVAVLGLGALTAALILALAQLIDEAWVAALIVAVAYLAIAGVLTLLGRNRIQAASPLVPEQASESVKEDVEWVKTQARSART